MKKIIIFSTAYLPFVGGAEIAVKEITDRLGAGEAGGEYEFDLITARLDNNLALKERIGRINVFRTGFGSKIDKFLLPVFGLFKAIELNSKNNYDLIWAVMASQAGITACFFKIIFSKKKLVLTLQEGDDEEHLKRYVFGNDALFKNFIQPLHRLVIKKADRVIAISKSLRDRAVKSGARGEVLIVPNGVNIEKFERKNRPPELADALKSSLGTKKDEKVIITVSRLVKKNGIFDLVRACGILSSENPEIKYKLVIIGTGELEADLKELVKNAKLENEIKFLGSIPNEEVPNYLWISDVFVRPSLSEGLGNVFFEAMAAGVPVIATPVGGITDFLIDGETGLFSRVNDPASLKEKMHQLLSDSVLREKLINNSKMLVKEKYNWTQIAERYKTFL